MVDARYVFEACKHAVAWGGGSGGLSASLSHARSAEPTEVIPPHATMLAARRGQAASLTPMQPPAQPADLPDLVSRRDSMPSLERWQTLYVRYKTQPEASVTHAGWELATSRKYAERLAAEEASFAEDTLLYNGLAPARISLKIVDAPAEYAVPVKQDRWARAAQGAGRLPRDGSSASSSSVGLGRTHAASLDPIRTLVDVGEGSGCSSPAPWWSVAGGVPPPPNPLASPPLPHAQPRRLTPNFKVRVDVEFQDRCSFPLTLKAYIISQQDKDSVPEWVPEDFLDPDAPPVSWRGCVGLVAFGGRGGGVGWGGVGWWGL